MRPDARSWRPRAADSETRNLYSARHSMATDDEAIFDEGFRLELVPLFYEDMTAFWTDVMATQ